MRSLTTWSLHGPSGETWDAARLASDLSAVLQQNGTSPDALVDDLVSARGYAATQVTPAACHVKAHPAMIRPDTLERIETIVAAQPSQMIVGRYYSDRWHIRLHVYKSEFLNFLNAAIEREQTAETDLIKWREISPAALQASATPALDKVMQLIRSCSSRPDGDMLAKIDALTDGRFLISRWHPDASVWQIEASGTGYTKGYVDLSRHRMIGTQPAYQYGCWLHDRYSEVMGRDEPVVADIDATVRATGLAPKRLTYRRVLSPITGGDGSRLLLSTSMHDAAIDLRSTVDERTPI